MENEQNPQGMQQDALDPVQRIAAILQEVRNIVNSELQGATLMAIRLRMDNQLGQMLGFLAGISGAPFMSPGPSGAFGNAAMANLDQPLTRMFGVDIDRARPIRPDDLLASAGERQAFRQQAQAAADQFLERTDEELLQSTRVPGGEAALRAVAKTAGHENYREQSMDLAFIQEIRLLLEDKRQVVNADQLAMAAGTRATADGDTGSQAVGAPGGEGWPKDVPADDRHLEAVQADKTTGGAAGQSAITGEDAGAKLAQQKAALGEGDPQRLVPGDGLPAGTETTGSVGSFRKEDQAADGDTTPPAAGKEGSETKAGTHKAGPGRPPKTGGK